PRMLQSFGEVYTEQFFVTLYALWLVESVPDIVKVSVHIQCAAFRQTFFQRAVRTIAIRFYDCVGRLVRQQHIAEDHRVAREIEAVFHPPAARMIAVVITAYQNLTAR